MVALFENPQYIDLVPRDYTANLRYREEILRIGSSDLAAARELWIMAARDVLWYINTFCWCFNPKDYKESPRRPFITHQQQDEAILEVVEAFGRHDLCIPKSRDQGGTQLCIQAIEWAWHFHEHLSFLVASRKQEFVDKRGSTKTLFYRLDFCHQHQPHWILPTGRRLGEDDPNRKINYLGNADNGSVIEGEATVQNLGVGDKKTAILMDERALMEQNRAISVATREATNCRLSNSTPRGTGGNGGEFFNIYKNPDISNVILHWSCHPLKSRGIYTSIDGVLHVLDNTYRFPNDYEFILDGDQVQNLGYHFLWMGERVKVRSPWYDEQCRRAGNRIEIAQELDIDFISSGSPFFDALAVDRYRQEHMRPPLHQGAFSVNLAGENPEFDDVAGGELKLWTHLTWKREPVEGDYGIACDIATGTGGSQASNSVASIGDRVTGKKVAELTTNSQSPEEFARNVVGLCRWFSGAYLAWETGGPGSQFGKEVMDVLEYRHVYYPPGADQGIRAAAGAPNVRKPGFAKRKETWRSLIGELRSAMFSHRFINPCEEAIAETEEYIHTPDGKIEHSRQEVEGAPEDSGENHGDRVVADALLCRLMYFRHDDLLGDEAPPREIPVGCLADRRRKREEREQEKQRKRTRCSWLRHRAEHLQGV